MLSARLFVEKEYQNIYLLSGGFEQFAEEHMGLLAGKLIPKPKKIIAKKSLTSCPKF